MLLTYVLSYLVQKREMQLVIFLDNGGLKRAVDLQIFSLSATLSLIGNIVPPSLKKLLLTYVLSYLVEKREMQLAIFLDGGGPKTAIELQINPQKR